MPGSIQDVDGEPLVVSLALDVYVSQTQFDVLGVTDTSADNVRVREYVLQEMNGKLRETGMVWLDTTSLVIRLKPEPWINGSRVYEVSGQARESQRVRQLRLHAEMADSGKENVLERWRVATEKWRETEWSHGVALNAEIQKRADLVIAYDGHLARKDRAIRFFRVIAAVVTAVDIVEVLALAHLL